MNVTESSSRSVALAMHLPAAQQALAETIRAEVDAGVAYFDSTAAVSDRHITPFLQAMRVGGWISKLSKSGCLAETRPCEHCRQAASRYAFLKDGTEIQSCVYCDN